jgi:hypothetical protein
MAKPPPRQWVIDHDSPFIERTPEEAQLYFKRRRELARRKLIKHAPYLSAALEKLRLLEKKGHLDS